jgi:hypothetical protein
VGQNVPVRKGDEMTDRARPLCPQRMGQNNNPLYIEYSSHLGCYCYKIDLPWTKYRRHTVVLCEVAEGLEFAKERAAEVIVEHLSYALRECN